MAESRISFEQYVERMVVADEADPEPICMFPHWNAECYVDRRDPKFGCLNCPAARKSYEKLDPEWVQKYMKGE